MYLLSISCAILYQFYKFLRLQRTFNLADISLRYIIYTLQQHMVPYAIIYCYNIVFHLSAVIRGGIPQGKPLLIVQSHLCFLFLNLRFHSFESSIKSNFTFPSMTYHTPIPYPYTRIPIPISQVQLGTFSVAWYASVLMCLVSPQQYQ